MPIRIVEVRDLWERRDEVHPTDRIGCDLADVEYAVEHLVKQGAPEPNVYVVKASCQDADAEEVGGRTMYIYAGTGQYSRAAISRLVGHEYGHSTEKEAFTAEDREAFRKAFAFNTNGVLPDHVLFAVRGWSEIIAESFAYLFGPPEVWQIPWKFKQYTGDFGFGPNATPGFEARHETLRAIFREAWRRRGYPLRPPGEQAPQPQTEAPEPKKPGASPFVDVAGHWAEADILACAEVGILRGDPDGRFRPDDKVTRAELATVLVRLRREE